MSQFIDGNVGAEPEGFFAVEKSDDRRTGKNTMGCSNGRIQGSMDIHVIHQGKGAGNQFLNLGAQCRTRRTTVVVEIEQQGRRGAFQQFQFIKGLYLVFHGTKIEGIGRFSH